MKDIDDKDKKLSPLVERLIKESVERNIKECTEGNPRYKNILNKTLEVLETYKILKDYVEHEEKNNLTIETLKNVEKEKIQNFMIASFVEDIEDINYEKLFKQTKETKIFLEMVTNIFKDYTKDLQKRNVDRKNKIKFERKIKIVEDYYMKGRPLSEITSMYENERSFYYDRDEIIKELAPRLFGIHGVNFIE